MSLLLAAALLVVIWLARPRPLLPRDRATYVSEKWRLDHLYSDGKNGR